MRLRMMGLTAAEVRASLMIWFGTILTIGSFFLCRVREPERTPWWALPIMLSTMVPMIYFIGEVVARIIEEEKKDA